MNNSTSNWKILRDIKHTTKINLVGKKEVIKSLSYLKNNSIMEGQFIFHGT